MGSNINISPYYDDHITQYYNSKYKKVLFVPGKAPQARELTQLQSFQEDQRRSNWDTMYRNGSVVEGCSLAVTIVPGGQSYVDLPEGIFYFEGRALAVAAQQLNIDASGDEDVGLFVEESFVDYNDDSTITDPASGYTNYSLDGAHRLKVEAIVVKVIPVADPKVTLPATQKYDDDENTTILWNITDGIIQNYLKKADYTVLSKVLAKRTYDESGNYLVEGMTLTTEESDTTDYIKALVSPGLCYVRGYDSTYIVPNTLEVPKSLTTTQHLNEPQTFASGTDEYELIYPYVVTDTSVHLVVVTAIVLVSSMDISRGGGDYDSFQDILGPLYTSIESIISIPGYTDGVDFELSSDTIHWLAGARPAGGATYAVNFRYYKDAVRDTDFSVDEKSDDPNVYEIVWGLGGDDPADTTNFLVDYYTYKARTDLFSIDKFGSIIRKEGVPTEFTDTVVPPFNNNMLPLGWIKFMPGLDYDDALVYLYNFKRSTMFELHYLKKRVDDLEENQAALALESEAKEGELSTNLKGIFVDPFNTLWKASLDDTDYYASTNLLDGELIMVSGELDSLSYDRTADVLINVDLYSDQEDVDNTYCIAKTADTAFFEITQKTDTMNLNPHGFIRNLPTAVLNPKRDQWIEDEIIEKTIVGQEIRTVTTNKHQLQWVANPTTDTSFIKEKMNIIKDKVGQEMVRVGNRLTTYARRKTITVIGRNFDPLSVISATFGGFDITLSAVAPWLDDVTTSKVQVAADGSFTATFYMPAKVKSGNIELKLYNASDDELSVIYRSKGVIRTIENRTVITTIVDKEIDLFEIIHPPVNPDPVPTPGPLPGIGEIKNLKYEDITKDPLAQSFIFAEDHIISKVDFWFGTKADDNPKPVVADDYYNTDAFEPTIPAILTMGYMKNGTPDNKNLILLQEIYPDDITTSQYGTTATTITLNKPIYIPAMTEFYISIGSKSTEYTVFVAALGETDLSTGQIVMSNPYQDGVLFTSSNGITWSAVQDKDMAIRLYSPTFETSGSLVTEEIEFPQSTWTGYGRFIFYNNYTETPYSKAQFYYSTDSAVTWVPFNPGDEVNPDANSTKLMFKCEFTGNGTTTPFVEFLSNIIFFKYDVSQNGIYITKTSTGVPEYDSVRIMMDENTSGSTNVIKEFSPENVSSTRLWLRFVQDAVASVDIGDGFYKNTYEFDYALLQRLTVVSVSGFAIGDDIKYAAAPSNTSKITAIDSTNKYIYILLDDDGETRYTDSHQLTNGVTTTDIDAVYDYLSEPSWPTIWAGKLIMESVNFWKTPTIKNYRAIMKAT